MDGINFVLKENKEDKNVILTSTITIIELLEGKIDRQKELLLQECFKRPNLIQIDVGIKVALESRRIRDHYYRKHGYSGRTVGTPDAIHLATGIVFKVDEFHTLDGKDKKNHLGLLPLSGNVAGKNLKICKPYVPDTKSEDERGPAQLKMNLEHRQEPKCKQERGWLISGRSGGATFVG